MDDNTEAGVTNIFRHGDDVFIDIAPNTEQIVVSISVLQELEDLDKRNTNTGS